MQVRGTIGAKSAVTTLHYNGVDIKIENRAAQSIRSLWLIGLQRLSKHLKTCDVVWVDGANNQTIVQTIDPKDVELILNNAPCKVYMLGMDPPPWSKLSATARKNDWKSEDWNYVFSDDPEERTEAEESDDEWLPGSESDEEDNSDFEE
jgi:hypothetical protein